MKTDFESIKRENERLKTLVKQAKEREDRVQQAFENSKVRELAEKVGVVSLLDQHNEHVGFI
jgi:hypothetical protein